MPPHALAATLTALREKVGVSLTNLAKVADIPVQTLFEWENGRGTAQYDKLKVLADYFDAEIQGKKITMEFLTLGGDDTHDELSEEIQRLKTKLFNAEVDALFKEEEMKNQLDFFKEQK